MGKVFNGSNTVQYNVYTDSGYTTIWGDGTSGTSDYSVLCALGCSSSGVPMYGKVPGGQNPSVVGLYQDLLTITASF